MEKYITDERTGLKYELVGDYYYLCLKAPEAPRVGRFGMLYHDYLRNHKKATYSGLMLSGILKEHIEDADRQAEDMYSYFVKQIVKQQCITENLKRHDQMAWIGAMNNIRNCADEMVLAIILNN